MIAPVNGQATPMVQMPGVGGASNGNLPNTMPTSVNPAAPSQIATSNPYAAPTAGPTGTVPTSSPVNGLPPGTEQTSPIAINTNQGPGGSYTVQGDFDATYGQGTGNAITDVLQNLGTSNDAAVQALINNTNLEAGKQVANIQSSEAASGITPNSSTAALATGDFYSSVNANLQSTVANMEQGQENTLLSTLMNEGSSHGPDESTFESIMDAVGSLGGVIGGGAQTASGITSAINPSADTGILDAIGALAF